ncbi:hypothetical protein BJX76DRAFT_352123 [Aspergillus varians]
MTARQPSTTPCHPCPDNNVRKRVCKACDWCRLKKSKCDGHIPCGRCRANNIVCVFGNRKRAPTHDRVLPKGYIEILERQQTWLVYGLQELYRLLRKGERLPNNLVKCEPDGHPLTHDLLTQLGILDHIKADHFEENTEALQQELCEQNARGMQNRYSSESSLERAQTPTTNSCFGDVFTPFRLPPTPPTTFSPAALTQVSTIKSEPQSILPHSPLYGAPLSTTSQGPSQLSNSSFDAFDEICTMEPSAAITSLPFDDQTISDASMINCQIPTGCMTMPASSSFMDARDDYDDFYQYLNLDPATLSI